MSTEKEIESFCTKELLSNSFLEAIRPGGILHYSVERGPLEALLVPCESSLEEGGISTFLCLGAALSGKEEESSSQKLREKHIDAVQNVPEALKKKLKSIDGEQHRKIATTLRTFLRYHLVHFEKTGSRFITAQGHRGEVSDSLEEVKRYGKEGSSRIMGDCDALKSSVDRTVAEYHPMKMHIFFIDKPLMDPQEKKNFLMELNSIIEPIVGARVVHSPTSRPSPSPARLDAYFANPTGSATATSVASSERVALPAAVASAPDPGEDSSSHYTVIDVDVPDDEELEDVVQEEELKSFATRTADRDKRQQKRNKHAAVRTHDYNRESIINYRHVVAADNDVNYDAFQIVMSRPYSSPLVLLVSNFVEQSQRKNKIFLDNHLIVRFMNQFFEEAYRIPEINEHEHTVTILAEGVEKYLTTKLYREMFGVNPEIMKENKAMEEKLIRLENLSADDLDALQEVEDHHVWGQAMFELDAMNFFKSPRDKLRCGMRACELLSLALRDVLNKRSGKTTPPPSGQPSSNSNNALLAFGADEFVPCFILLVLRARSYNYYANVRYIDDFRAPQLMNPEESYCLANLMSAAAFWMECDDNGRIASRRRQDRPSLPVKSGGGGDSSTGSPTTGNTEDEKASTSHDRLPPPPSLSDRDLLPSIQKGILVEPLSASSTPKRDKLNTFKQGLKKERDSVLDALFGWSTSTSPKAVATDAPPKEEPAKANTFSEMFYRLTSPNTEKGTVETPVSATVVSKPLPSPAVKKLMSQKNSFEELSVTELKLVFDEMKRICQE